MKRILVKPLISEKSASVEGKGVYVFAVSVSASKQQIAQEVEKTYHTKVSSVRTICLLGKQRRVSGTRRYARLDDWKKAYVQLAKGESISIGGDK